MFHFTGETYNLIKPQIIFWVKVSQHFARTLSLGQTKLIMSEAIVNYTLAEGVATITLNRPQKYNSFTRDLALALQAALDQARDDEAVRAIVITGAGKAFCAGQDLAEATAEDGPSLSTILVEHLNPIINRMRELEKPIVAAINGVAAGAGVSMALAADLTIASDSASFIQAFSKIGLIPDSGATYFLPRLIGLQKATALMMLGNKVSAKEAEAMGMIYQVVAKEDFAETVQSLANQLAQMPTRALGMTKRALNKSLNNDLSNQLALEEHLQSDAGMTEDYAEGVQAFLEKRNPKFTGR